MECHQSRIERLREGMVYARTCNEFANDRERETIVVGSTREFNMSNRTEKSAHITLDILTIRFRLSSSALWLYSLIFVTCQMFPLHIRVIISILFFCSFRFCSIYRLKLECEKLTNDKTEMQRHYVMVSKCSNYLIRNNLTTHSYWPIDWWRQ